MATIENITNGSIGLSGDGRVASDLSIQVQNFTAFSNTYPGFTDEFILFSSGPASLASMTSLRTYANANGYAFPSVNTFQTRLGRLSLHADQDGQEINSWECVLLSSLSSPGKVGFIIAVEDSFDSTNTGLVDGIYPTVFNGPNLSYKLTIGDFCINLNEPCVTLPDIPGVDALNSTLGINPTTRRLEVRANSIAGTGGTSVLRFSGQNSTGGTNSYEANNIVLDDTMILSPRTTNAQGLIANIGQRPYTISGDGYPSAVSVERPVTRPNSISNPDDITFSDDFVIRRAMDAVGDTPEFEDIIIEIKESVFPEFINIDGNTVNSIIGGSNLDIELGNNISGTSSKINTITLDVSIPDVPARYYDAATNTNSGNTIGNVRSISFDDRHFTISQGVNANDLRIIGTSGGSSIVVQDNGVSESNPVTTLNFSENINVIPSNNDPAQSSSVEIRAGAGRIWRTGAPVGVVERPVSGTGGVTFTEVNPSPRALLFNDNHFNITNSGGVFQDENGGIVNVGEVLNVNFDTTLLASLPRIFTHTQTNAAETWVVNHLLNNDSPIVQVYDADGNMVLPMNIARGAAAQASTQTMITFPIAVAGKATILG